MPSEEVGHPSVEVGCSDSQRMFIPPLGYQDSEPLDADIDIMSSVFDTLTLILF